MSEIEKNKLTETEAAAKIAATPTVVEIGNVQILCLPEGYTSEDRHDLLPTPIRKKGNVEISEVQSFIDFSKRYGSLTNSNIYLDVNYAQQKVRAIAIFNDHKDGDGEAGWRDHRAIFEPQFTPEWGTWNTFNKRSMSQTEFAHFLEANISDISGGEKLPSGSDVLTFVSNLEETRNVKYGSAVNLQNGMVQIQFTEDGDSKTRGNLEVFKEFAIGIRPFMNGDAYQIRAFLRYRIDRNSGTISFAYELQRPDRILEDATKELIERIKTTTGIPVVFGTP